MNNWERRYNKEGCPYYLNLKTKKSQWEHPYFAQILSDSDEYNDVIYAAYRTALKLLHIRNNLHLQLLKVEKIELAFNDVFPVHNIRIDEYLTLSQLDEILAKLYCSCDTSLSQPVWAGAVGSCLLYFFDSKRRGTLNTLSVLVLLTTLCSDNLNTKYSFIFSCFSEHRFIGAPDISHLKRIVFTILSQIREDGAFKNAYEGQGTTMTEEMFVTWLLSEPKFMVWLALLHRIQVASTVRHDVKCYICKDYPIVGLRYRCLQCFNVDMCFQCFTRMPVYGKHDKCHAIEEFCTQSNKIQDVKAFFVKVRNNLKKKSKPSKIPGPESHLTAKRQPATVWHDPKLLQNSYTAETDIHNGMQQHYEPLSSTSTQPRSTTQGELYSPRMDTLKVRSRTSTLDGYNSLAHGYTAFTSRDGNNVYKDKYCTESLRSKQTDPQNHQSYDRRYNTCGQSSDEPAQYITTLPKNHFAPQSPQANQPSRLQHQPITATPRAEPPARRSFYESHYATLSESRRMPRVAPRYQSTPQNNYIKPRTSTSNELEERTRNGPENSAFTFYTPIHPKKGATPREQYNRVSILEDKSTLKSCLACSEDEGVVLNSESDESSQYAALTLNRDALTLARFTEPLRVDTGHPPQGMRTEFDYTRYSWDQTNETKLNMDLNLDQHYKTGERTFNYTHNEHNGTLDYSYGRGDMYQAVEGVRRAISPMVRRYKS